jgi:spermidine synthase
VRILIGGFGVGFSLDEALGHPAVAEVAVIEVEVSPRRGPSRRS